LRLPISPAESSRTRVARWAGESRVNFLTSSVVNAEKSTDFESVQLSLIRTFRAAHPLGAARSLARARRDPDRQRVRRAAGQVPAYVQARLPRTRAPVGPARVTEVAFALPFTF
jgi:hypothetical protein